MKNQKAMLLTEEVLKMIIALIGLALLAYFLVSFFTSDVKAEKQRQAAATIETLSGLLSNISENPGIDEVQPQGWTLFSFVGDETKPNQCSNENCICICNKVIADVLNMQVKKCTKEGSCLVIPNLNKFEDIKIERYNQGGTSILIQEEGGKIRIVSK